jgi:hypothetical protein
LSDVSVLHSKSVLYGISVWGRAALHGSRRRFPARAGWIGFNDDKGTVADGSIGESMFSWTDRSKIDYVRSPGLVPSGR